MHSRPKDGVASLAYSRPKDGVVSLAYGVDINALTTEAGTPAASHA
jgi:hypothetical protein